MSQPNQRYGFDPRRANEGGAPYQQNYQNQQPNYNAGGLQNPYDNRSGIPNPTGQHQQYAPSTTAPYGARPVAINQQNPNPAAMYHPQSGPPNQAAPYSVNSNYHPTQSPTTTGYSNTAPSANNNYYPSGNNPVSNNTSLNSLKETLAKTISSITAAAANNNSTGYQQGIAPGGRQLVPPTRMVPGDVRYQSTVPTTTTTATQNPGTTGGFYNRRPEGNMAGPGQRDLSTAYDPSVASYHTTAPGSTPLQQQHGVHTGYSPAHAGLTGQRSSATQQYVPQQQQQYVPQQQQQYAPQQQQYAPQQYSTPQHQHPATTTNHTGQYPLDQYKQTGVPAFSPTHSPVLTSYNTTPNQRDMYVPTTGNNPRDQYVPTGNIPRDQYVPAGNIPRDQYVPTGSAHYIPPQQPAVQPPTRWSQRLMDPLDLHDGLLHSIFTRPVHTSTERMHTSTSTRVSAVPPPTATTNTSSRSVNTSDLSRYGPGRGGSSPTNTKRRRERSVSPVASRTAVTTTSSNSTGGRARPRSRSRSITPAPSSSTNTGSSATEMPPPSGTRRASNLPYGARPAKALSYSTVPVAVLNEEYHLPNIRIHTYPTITLLPPPQQQLYNELTAPTTQCVNSIDLYTHFPKLYLPNDFASISIADSIIETALHNDVFSDLMNTVPIEIESNNPTLLPNSHPCRILSTPTEPISSEMPKFSYVPSNTLNNKVFSEVPQLTDGNGQQTISTTTTTTKAQFIGSSKPVKFQVRVLVSCGLKDPASERLDHNLAQKLRCIGVETSLKLQLFVYTIQTLPILGRVDLAAVFFNSQRWSEEHMYFSNFSDVSRFPCKGCQDGYLTETLVNQRFWTYTQLPIDGLKSMVFHGPSPTLCIASGNVWFDFPEVNKLGCVSHSTIGALYPSQLYDLGRFYDTKSSRVCLRLSQKGYWNRTGSVIV